MTAMLELLTDSRVELIIADALVTLERVGVLVENASAFALCNEAGLRCDGQRVYFDEATVQDALQSAPSELTLYDREGEPAMHLAGDATHFCPGSAALRVLDPQTGRRRDPLTRDCVHLAWVTQACAHIAGQSTAIIPADVPALLADRFRLYVALLHCSKPVQTGTFHKDAFAVMRQMLLAVRGDETCLRQKPLALFSCAPTPPLKWSDLTCQALIDCARAGIPVELVSMPLAGATAPVTLRDLVVQQCAENLSGVVIHQLAGPSAPVLYGGCPSALDMRHGTTPMGAIESMMINVASAQVGRKLALPTQAYMALSDAKTTDWQAGAESAVGAVLAALGGVNLISGPGMLDFVSCQSLEKLVLDNQACGMALRLARGISAGSPRRTSELLQAVVQQGSFLAHPHTRANFRDELLLVGKIIDRGSYGDWERRGALDAFGAATEQVQRIVARGNTRPLADDVQRQLHQVMQVEARRLGLEGAPELD